MNNSNVSDWQKIKLLTVPEVAQWARVHPKTVLRWIHADRLKAVRFGSRTYRIPEAEVKRLLREMGLQHLLTDRGDGAHVRDPWKGGRGRRIV